MNLNHNVLVLARDARSYYDAYEVLREKKERLHHMDLSTPSLLCLAFSMELHLKLLLRTFEVSARGHDISKLLNKLPADEIACMSSHPDFHPTQQGQYFHENIAIASDLFIRTRYYFEELGMLQFNTGFCITLAKIIRKRIVKRVPYLTYNLGVVAD